MNWNTFIANGSPNVEDYQVYIDATPLDDRKALYTEILACAGEKGYLEVAKFAMANSALLEWGNYFALAEAIAWNHPDLVEYFLSLGSLSARTMNEMLRVACLHGRTEIITMLLSKHAHDENGIKHSIRQAARENKLEVLQLLAPLSNDVKIFQGAMELTKNQPILDFLTAYVGKLEK